ncbi:MAG TPA: GNAT family N-acetyltransferase [Terracidiphilus sp.]|nr:GNAT family N-acetyltransferase [Terracidiphilus sp.]
MAAASQPVVNIRVARPEDAETCGRICFHAFSTINAAHGFPCDFPGPEVTTGMFRWVFAHPEAFYSVVGEVDGRIVGSNAMDERSPIRGVGPITVDPDTQNAGVGRQLMKAVMDRAEERGAAGLRLVQAAFHTRSMSLYASLGFDVREPLACMQGKTQERGVEGCTVRPATAADLDACNELSRSVHGFDRGGDLAQETEAGNARVVERGGRITGYASELAFFGHATAESNLDLQALLASAERFGGPGILVPTRNAALLRWCLANGLRIVQPMTLMTMGLYNQPAGAWLPSVMF